MKLRPFQAVAWTRCCRGGISALLLIAAHSGVRAEDRRREPDVYQTDPAFKELMHDVVFWVNFERSAEPVMGTPNPDPAQTVSREYADAPGIVGKAFLSRNHGYCQYPTAGNLDFSRPGALSFWVSAYDWSWGEEQPLVLFFWTPDKPDGYLGIERQGAITTEGRLVRNDSILFFIQGFPNSEATTIKGIGLAGAPQNEWAKGIWHFFVFNWRGSLLEVSMDGGPLRSLDIGRAIEPKEVTHFRLGGSSEPTLLDEFMVYRRPLTPEDIKAIHQTLLPAVKGLQGK